MSAVPLRSSGSAPSSARSSISDIPMVTSRRHSTSTPYDDPDVRRSTSFDSNQGASLDDDLDIEDPLSRAYADITEFEPFSKSEYVFIGLSCFGVVLIPSLFLLITKLVTFCVESSVNRRYDLITYGNDIRMGIIWKFKVKRWGKMGWCSDYTGYHRRRLHLTLQALDRPLQGNLN